MHFVFGWYSFRLKSYSASVLGLRQDEWGTTTFEVRQKVFHLFWIPVFSLGKMYVVRKSNKLYDVPPELVSKIIDIGRVKTAWYAFLLPILVVCIPVFVGVFIYTAEAITKYNHTQRDKAEYEMVVADIQSELGLLRKGAYLHLWNTEKAQDKPIYLLYCVGEKEGAFDFLIKKVNFPKKSAQSYFFDLVGADTFHLTRDSLFKAVCTNYAFLKQRKPYGLPLIDTDLYIINKVSYFDEPIIDGRINHYFWRTLRISEFPFSTIALSNDKESSIALEFQNFGAPVNLVEICNVENDVRWENKLPMRFEAYQYLQYTLVEGKVKKAESIAFKSIFLFEDALQQRYAFEISGADGQFTINQKQRIE